jgi:hypothetical protein
MRRDALGMFWRDEPVVKVLKQKVKRTPPAPVWLADDYLPGLQEALNFDIPVFTDQELIEHAINPKKDRFLFDIEVYPNYFLAAFLSLNTGKIVYIEATPDLPLDVKKLEWILTTFTIVGFNSINFDIVITALALAGYPLHLLEDAAHAIIVRGENPRDVLKGYKVKPLKVDHIDLIEIAPLRASLKIYAGRLHSRRMQDLPFLPGKKLSAQQIAITRWYNVNSDLKATRDLYNGLDEQIKLRETLSQQYGVDLRSKSDAQIAETVFTNEVAALNGKRVARPLIMPGTLYRYRAPAFLQYSSDTLQYAFNVIKNAAFIVADHGSIEMPPEIADLKLGIAGREYQMGIGGLHSCEKCVSHVADDEYELWDYDVTSFYPKIILNQGLYPYHMGPNFLRVYRIAFDARVAAKKAGRKVFANGFKIVLNGSFGKLGSKWSNLYAPDLLIQVTITGQLSLLLLIERLEIADIHVVSANTDGIVIKCHKRLKLRMEAIIKQWEIDTRFDMECVQYSALYSKDVNNYIAVKTDGKTKTKGAYANPWNDDSDRSMWLHKNPTNTICVEAIEKFLVQKVPLATTISTCNDIRKFVSVRTVKGGAVKDGIYLGKSIRWYYAEKAEGEMVYASSGNKVPRSDGAKPLMDLPDTLPLDIDYQWYIKEAEKMLQDIAYN